MCLGYCQATPSRGLYQTQYGFDWVCSWATLASRVHCSACTGEQARHRPKLGVTGTEPTVPRPGVFLRGSGSLVLLAGGYIHSESRDDREGQVCRNGRQPTVQGRPPHLEDPGSEDKPYTVRWNWWWRRPISLTTRGARSFTLSPLSETSLPPRIRIRNSGKKNSDPDPE